MSSKRFKACLNTYHGLPHPFKDAGVVVDSLTSIQNAVVKCFFMSRGVAYTRVFGVPTDENAWDSNLASVEVMQWVPS
jgi:hypothetical protein